MVDAAQRVTRLLEEVHSGRAGALDELMELVYDDLRKVAENHLKREGPSRRITLQPTMLVNESFLRLVDQRKGFENRGQFFALASKLILRVLLDHERRQGAVKRGEGRQKITLSLEGPAVGGEQEGRDVVALSIALERLERLDARKAAVVRLRSLAGLTAPEVASELDLSVSTVERDWAFARAWLSREIERVLDELEGRSSKE